MDEIDLIKHKELIHFLDKEFKFNTPQPSDSIADIMYAAGARHTIDALVFGLKDQEEGAYQK
ncbi:hypothetical protein H0A36_29390 [Endozoicomonas sp. SM1973]|uniref:Uncharacterized protein n=1 Tax=Spartinivicinus marinus TaxID=2994442 RepID=A0A853IJ73_9GAMM|nr:hypothetical protein [Spartinivicinus marinus]MCX4024757.1 hypothetical protein [Spartinivicinus marinus]NYZ70131.1 hypothetical protein [Spartinivicinus marinus]